MRILAFLISIFLILNLTLIYLLIPPKTIYSLQDLQNLSQNQKVQFQGKVIKLTEYEEDYRIKLDNNLSFYYPKTKDSKNLINRTIKVQGKVSLYLNNTNINPDKIKIIN